MTLKEQKFKEEIQKPENHLNMAECMRKAGYSKASTQAGSKYRQLRKITSKLDFLEPDRINQDTEKNRRKADKKQNYAVVEAIDARRAKMAGMIIDKSEVKSDINIAQKQEINDIISNRLKTKDLESVTN